MKVRAQMIVGMGAALLLAAPTLASPQAAARAADVRSGFVDDLTEKFAGALRNALPKAKHMRVETGDDADDLYLSVLFPVDVEGKHFTYAVDLLKADPPTAPDRVASFTGTCRMNAIDVCAQDLIGKADKKAKD